MLKVKIVYKFILIMLLFFGICILSYSGTEFALGRYSEFLMSLHKFCGFSIVVVALLHMIVKRKKLIKLTNEFLDVVLNRKNPSFCTMERLIMALEDHTISSCADILNSDVNEIMQILKKENLKLKDKNQTFRQIAKFNNEKIFYILVLIIESKFTSKSSNLNDTVNKIVRI